MGSSGSSTKSTTQTTIPPQFLPFFTGGHDFFQGVDRGEGLFPRAVAASERVSDQPFQGPLIADVDPRQTQALNQQADFANQVQGSGGPENLINLANFTAQGGFLSPDSNPFLQDLIGAAIHPQLQAFQRALAESSSQAVGQGAFGGSRQGVLEAQLGDATQQNIFNTASNILGQNFARERGFQNASPQLFSQAFQSANLPNQLLGQVGGAFRGFEQESVEEAIERFNQAQAAPFAPLFPLAQILGSTDTGSQTVQKVRTSG